MKIRKIRGQNRVSNMALDPIDVELAKKFGIPLKTYAYEALVFIAKKRKWKWFFNRGQK